MSSIYNFLTLSIHKVRSNIDISFGMRCNRKRDGAGLLRIGGRLGIKAWELALYLSLRAEDGMRLANMYSQDTVSQSLTVTTRNEFVTRVRAIVCFIYTG